MKAKIWKIILACIIGFTLGVCLFLPWSSLSDYMLTRGLERAAENGIYGTVAENSVDGLFDKEFVFRGVQMDFPVFRFSTRELRVDPAMLRSIFTASPAATVTFGRGELMPVTRQKLEWNQGTAKISVKSGVVSVSEIEFTGKFSARGFLDFSPQQARITRANLTLKVPEEMDRALQMLGGSGMLPISKVGAGEWKVAR